MSYTPTRSIPPENITPAIGSCLEKRIDFVRTKKTNRVYGSDPFHCMSSLPTECLAKTNSLLGRWQACEINYSKARCISSEKNTFISVLWKFRGKQRERERDETSFRYDLRSLRSRVDCALFSNPLDLLSQIKKYFTGIIVVFAF